jgi:hypothetical protein
VTSLIATELTPEQDPPCVIPSEGAKRRSRGTATSRRTARGAGPSDLPVRRVRSLAQQTRQLHHHAHGLS